jgi:hypothetical protein
MQKDPAGNPAPKGGFQNLGWYSGYQYYNGSFAPQAGQIHPNSPQVGAGQAVSQEVNRQTSVAAGLAPGANQAYVDAQNAKPKAPAAPAPVNPNPGNLSAASLAEAGAGAGIGVTTPGTINLPDLYKNLSATSGIAELEADLSAKEKEYIEATGKINDNPFLSEATRVGRVAKMDELFQKRTANLRNEIATKKADIETQLNLQTKQFDINSQASRDALSQLNTLLSLGALENASGEDIANLTRNTGISSSMIQSAIQANKAKNVKSQVIQSEADDGTVTVTVINPDTGQIINQQSLGKIGNVQQGAQPKAQTASEQKASVLKSVTEYISSEKLQAQMSPEDVYKLLIQTYPEAFDYITQTWTPRDIRIANGEEKPYGED